MAAGVTIFRPETCVIDAEVEIEPDTVIEPFVQLLGRTRIGAESHIRSYTVIENCTLGNRVHHPPELCAGGELDGRWGADWPVARICGRAAKSGEDVHVGNFVETKKGAAGKA